MIHKIFTLILITFLTGCASQKYFNLQSLDENKNIRNGLQIVVMEDSTLASTINFEGQYNDHIVFYTYFENNSEDTLLVDPGKFEYEYFNFGTNIKVTEPVSRQKAYDPELQINVMNKALITNEEEKSALTFLNCLVGTASVIVSVATDDDDECDDDETAYNIADAVVGTVANQIAIESSYSEAQQAALEEREFWKNEVLRKTNLYPGDKIGGLVHFPLTENGGLLKINLKADNNIHQYIYKQSLIK